MIAVTLHEDVVLAGVAVPAHRTLEVVDEAGLYDGEPPALTIGQARALVEAGLADAVDSDFDELPGLIEAWQRA